MHLSNGGEYLGLPIPSSPENVALQSLIFDDTDQARLSEVFDCVSKRRLLIGELIQTDLDESKKESSHHDVSDIDFWEYGFGLEDGYKFVIGALTYVNYLRHAADNQSIEDYIDGIPDDSLILPLGTVSQYDRVHNCRLSLIDVDQTVHGEQNPAICNIARKDAADYLLRSEAIIDLSTDQASFRNNQVYPTGDSGYSYDTGFFEGRDNAISMYIQSYEQATLDRCEGSVGNLRGLNR